MDERKFKTFAVRYRHDGAEWGFELPARDLQDAKARLARLAYASVDGELVLTLPAATGPLAATVAALRNVFCRLLGRPF